MRWEYKRAFGVVCTVLGGILCLWLIARLSSAAGWQQTWAPPFGPYEWVTLGALLGLRVAYCETVVVDAISI